jgi:hypothetical protein
MLTAVGPCAAFPSTTLQALVDPVWTVPKTQLPDARVLAFRHPGFGWMAFLFPQQEADHVAAELTRTR